jgi:hypothetical protein
MTLDEAIRELRARHEPPPCPMRLPTPDEVTAAERALGVRFHPDFRRYLLEASDADVADLEPVTITRPESHRDLLQMAEGAWRDYSVPPELLPICGYSGDYYCMDADGHVVYWSHNGWDPSWYRDLATWIEQVWLADWE